MEQSGDVFARKLLHGSQRDTAEGKPTDLVAPKTFYGKPEGEEQLADFALLSVVHPHIQFDGTVIARIHECGALDPKPFVLHFYALDEAREASAGKRRVQTDMVAFHHDVARVHQLIGEIAISCQNHQSLGILIEPSRAEEAAVQQLMGKKIKNRARIVWVVIGAHEPTRFMDGDGHGLLARGTDTLILDRDLIDPGGDLLADFGDFAVYAHLAGLDQRLRGASGADPGIGDKFLETYFGGFQGLGSWLQLSIGSKD
mgnify:CR=1 FL=1